MGTWHDIQRGKAPWRPKLSFSAIAKRLAFSLPFLVFGFVVLYFIATCEISFRRNADRKVSAIVTKRYLGVPLFWQRLSDVTQVYVESEMRTVEKTGMGASSKSTRSLNEVPVSRIVLVGGGSNEEELAASQFRYSLDSEHHTVSLHLIDFLQSENLQETKQSIPYVGSSIPPLFAMIFTFGLGGFIFVSILVDMAIWWIQRRYKWRRVTKKVLESETKAGN